MPCHEKLASPRENKEAEGLIVVGAEQRNQKLSPGIY